METYTLPIQVRWSDMDANRHVRHSAYYDYAAAMRIMILSNSGLTLKKLEEFEIGPILFREEAIFKREIRLDDKINVDVVVVKSNEDFSRWSLRHHFTKEDGSIAAIVNIDGAWLDLIKRKLVVPPEMVQRIFASFPKTPDYELLMPNR